MSGVARFSGTSWPSGLLRLYRSTDGLKSQLGTVVWDGTPTITADGVTPGNGPSFGTLTRGNGKILLHKHKMTVASGDVVDDVHIFGAFWIRAGYLVAKVDGEEATHAHAWAVGDVVYAKVVSGPSTLTVGDI